MMNRRVAFLFLAVVIAATSAFAFQERFTPIDNVIDLDEKAQFNLTITNTGSTEEVYRLSLGVGQSTSWILSPNSLRVPAGESRTTTVVLKPRSGTSSGSYFTRITLQGEGERRTLSAPISLGQGGPRDFVPNVGMTVTNEEHVDPREPFPLSFEFHNRNQRELDNLTVEVNSDLFHTSFNLSLDGMEREGQNVFFTLNETTPPGNHSVNIDLFHHETNNPIASYTTAFTIIPYNTVTLQQNTKGAWFKTSYTVNLTNHGNVDQPYTYNVSAPWYERIFLSSTQATSLGTAADQTVKQWHLTIPPETTETIQYQRNYRGLVATIVIILLGIAAYFAFRSPVIAKKEAKIIKQPNGPDQLKIRVYLRNRGSKTKYNVSITDTLPSILEYKSYDDVGYISPSTVRKKRKGETTIHWDIDELDALEERILVYEATPRLEVLGEVDLPSVRAQFEDEDGNVRVYESWSVTAGSDTNFLEQK